MALPGLPEELLAVVARLERLDSEELSGQAVMAAQGSQQVVVLSQTESPGEGIGQIYPDTKTGQGNLGLEQRQLRVHFFSITVTVMLMLRIVTRSSPVRTNKLRKKTLKFLEVKSEGKGKEKDGDSELGQARLIPSNHGEIPRCLIGWTGVGGYPQKPGPAT